MAGLRLQATALFLLALSLCASATTPYYYGGHRRLSQAGGRGLLTYYYGGHRRLSEASGFGARQLLSGGYYYGGHSHRRLASYYYGGSNRRLTGASFVRPLFGATFLPGSQAAAADVPVPHFLTRQLSSYGGYYSSHRRLSSYYGGYGSHRRLSSYYYGGRH